MEGDDAVSPITDDQIRRFQRLYPGSDHAFGQYLDHPDPQKRDIKTVSGPVPTDAWTRHLAGGGHGLGRVPVDHEGNAYFGAIDDDEGKGQDVDHRATAQKVTELGLPLVVCRSKSGATHLYLFLKDPAPAGLVQERLREWAQDLGVTNPRSVEIFPKQKSLGGDSVGNWINLPYYGGDKTERYAFGADGEPMRELGRFLAFAEGQAVSADELESWGQGESGIDLSLGPPCLETNHREGWPTGNRDNGVFNLCLLAKALSPDTWEDDVRAYCREHVSLSERAVEKTIRSARASEYQYRGAHPTCCKTDPDSPYKAECQKRDFGSGKVGDALRTWGKMPHLANLQRLEVDPVIWKLEVNGQVVEFETADLLSYGRFERVVFEKVGVVVPPLKKDRWRDRLNTLVQNRTTVEAPEDAGPVGMFKSILLEFMEQRRKAEAREDLMRGLPYEEDGQIHFRGLDLRDHLQQHRFFSFKENRVFDVLREMGGGTKTLRVPTHPNPIKVWWLPVAVVEGQEQTEPFTSRASPNPEF